MNTFPVKKVTGTIVTNTSATIENGNSITVYSILLNNEGGTAATVSITDNDNNTIFHRITLATKTKSLFKIKSDWNCKIPFIADNGIKVVIGSDSGVVVRYFVFYSNVGA